MPIREICDRPASIVLSCDNAQTMPIRDDPATTRPRCDISMKARNIPLPNHLQTQQRMSPAFDTAANVHISLIGDEPVNASIAEKVQLNTVNGLKEVSNIGQFHIADIPMPFVGPTVDGFERNIVSAQKFLSELGLQANLTGEDGIIFNPSTGSIVHKLTVDNGIYVFLTEESYSQVHRMWGHCSDQALQRIYGAKLPKQVLSQKCEACLRGKMRSKAHRRRHRNQESAKYSTSFYPNPRPLSVVRTDTSGPHCTGFDGERYFAPWYDDFSGYSAILTFSHKALHPRLWERQSRIEMTRLGDTISKAVCDGAKEFKSNAVKNFQDQQGIIASYSERYDPASNATIESFIGILKNTARCMLLGANVPTLFWPSAIRHASFINGHTPKSLNGSWRTPLGLYLGIADNEIIKKVKNLPSFGEIGYALVPKPKRDGSFSERASICVFLGIEPLSSRFLVYSFKENRILPVRTASFTGSFKPKDWWLENGFDLESNFKEPFDADYEPFQDDSLCIDATSQEEENLDESHQEYDIREHLDDSHPEDQEMRIDVQQTEMNQIFDEEDQEDSDMKHVGDADMDHVDDPKDSLTDHENIQDSFPTVQSDNATVDDRPRRRAATDGVDRRHLSDERSKEIDKMLFHAEVFATKLRCRRILESEIEHWIPISDPTIWLTTLINDLDQGEEEMTDHIQEEPKNWKDALCNPAWRTSMREELNMLLEKKTWIVKPRVNGRRPIKSTWAFRLKKDEAGKVTRLKSRLAACGYSQIPGLDFDETYAAVGTKTSLRSLIALKASGKLAWRQLDVDAAFLNGILPEEDQIPMEFPPGYHELLGLNPEEQSSHCLLLKKSLYGLRQSAEIWYKEFHQFMIKTGYSRSSVDDCLFINQHQNDLPAFVWLYVDDQVIVTSKEDQLDRLIQLFPWSIKVLGEPRFILGIEVVDSEHEIWIGQKQYATEITKNFLHDDTLWSPVTSPINQFPSVDLAQESPLLNKEMHAKYRSMTGCIQYLGLCTRPDLAFSGSLLGKYVHEPRMIHWEMGIRVVRYILGTLDEGISYPKGCFLEGSASLFDHLTTFADSDYAGDPECRRSRSGYCSLLFGSIIDWKSKQHGSVALSSCEAEIYGICDAVKELMFLRIVIWELDNKRRFPGEDIMSLPRMHICCDNTASMVMNFNGDSLKHVQVRYRFIKDLSDKKELQTSYVKSGVNVADLFTKPLKAVDLSRLMRLSGMRRRPCVDVVSGDVLFSDLKLSVCHVLLSMAMD
jgi:transposase InsO family protein